MASLRLEHYIAQGAFEPLVSFLPAEASALSKAPTQPTSPSAGLKSAALIVRGTSGAIYRAVSSADGRA